MVPHLVAGNSGAGQQEQLSGHQLPAADIIGGSCRVWAHETGRPTISQRLLVLQGVLDGKSFRRYVKLGGGMGLKEG